MPRSAAALAIGACYLTLRHPRGTGIGPADDKRDKPEMVANDNEFKSNAILTRTDRSRVAWGFIVAGKHMRNAFSESLGMDGSAEASDFNSVSALMYIAHLYNR